MKHQARKYLETRVSADINMTNLVDVCLVLLIIFILVAPVMEQGISIQLPKTSVQKMQMPESLTVSIGKNGELFLADRQLTLDELQAKLKVVAENAPETPVIVRADKDIRYERLMEVMDRIRTAGLSKLGMATQAK